MTDWKVKYGDSPVYRLNSYITNKLASMEFIDLSKYKTDLIGGEFVIPFMLPGQDLPEVTTVYDQDEYQELSYCIYSVSDRLSTDEPYMSCGQIAYTFYHLDIDYLIGMKDYLTELLKREDWSAQDVNDYFSNSATYPFDFKFINVLTTAGPSYVDDEGGRSSMLIVVRYDATYEGPGRNYTLVPGQGKGFGMR